MTVYIIDNIPGYNRISGQWKIITPYLQEELNDIEIQYIGSDKLIYSYEFLDNLRFNSKIHDLVINEIVPDLKNGDVLVFTDIRTMTIYSIREYINMTGIDIKIIGFWNDGNWNINGYIHSYYNSMGKKANSNERLIHVSTDYPCVTIPTHTISSRMLRVKKDSIVPLPFQLLEKHYPDPIPKELDIIHNSYASCYNKQSEFFKTVFKTLSEEIRPYRLVDLDNIGYHKERMLDILETSVGYFSTSRANINPFDIYHAAVVNSAPLLFYETYYKRMGLNMLLYSDYIMKPPMLKYLRGKEEFKKELFNRIENRDTFNKKVVEVMRKLYDPQPFINLIKNVNK